MKWSLLILAFAFWGCANTNCRNLADQKGEARPPVKKELDPMTKSSPADRVFVHKADGSLQCNQGKPVALNDMRKELGEIAVYSSSKRNDGQMRIQVCGSPTGNSNVFEINRADLEQALKLGFEEWIYN